MKRIKLFEEFNTEEFEQEDIVQEEPTKKEGGYFDSIIELLSMDGEVYDVECEDDECEFTFNGLEIELEKNDDDTILIMVKVDGVSDSIGSFKSNEIDDIVEAITKYKVN